MTKAEKIEMLTIGRQYGMGITWNAKKHILARDVEGLGKAGDTVLAGCVSSGGVKAWNPRIKSVVCLHINDLARPARDHVVPTLFC